MMIAGSLLTLVLFGATSSDPTAEQLLARLDLASFPNSTGPRHLARPTIPAAAGFSEALSTEEGQAIRDNGRWRIGLRILAVRGDTTDVCFTDGAQNGGSYFVQTVLTLATVGGGYAAQKGPAYSDCPERRSRADAAPRP